MYTKHMHKKVEKLKKMKKSIAKKNNYSIINCVC